MSQRFEVHDGIVIAAPAAFQDKNTPSSTLVGVCVYSVLRSLDIHLVFITSVLFYVSLKKKYLIIQVTANPISQILILSFSKDLSMI